MYICIFHICVNQTVVFSDTNGYNIISTPLTLAQRPDLTDVPCSAATMSSVRRTATEVDVSGAVRGAGRTSLSMQGKEVENGEG